jgi:serine/threonine protein kinase
MSSIWGSRFSDEGGQHSVSYRSHKDEGEIDVGDILAAARNELPYIPSHRLTHDMFLGRGSSYQVTREVYANPRVSEFYVAVKCLRTVTESDYVRTKRYAAVLREVRVLTHPPLRSHGCIVPALGYGWKRDTNEGARPFMVMDYSDHGSLPQYLNRCRIPFHERIEFGIDIAAGLKSLHACGIIHGDLKPDNVMVFDHGDRLSKRPQGAKLADFGCSIFEQDFNAAKDVFYLGTPKYNAPEIVGRLSPYVDAYVQSFDSFALADCYSFGLSLWELLRNGKDYIEDSLLQKDEGPAAFLARISATQEDGLLALATDYCDHIPDRTQGDFSIPSLKLLFSLTLKDRRSCRATMEEVGRVLAGESR